MEQKLKDFGDAKRNIFEHLVLSASIFLGALFWDHIVNLMRTFNIFLVQHETGSHVYHIGEFQIIVMILAAIHFIRKYWNEWRCYE